jgi:hypothetical protein
MQLKSISPGYWLGYIKSCYRLLRLTKPPVLIGGCGRTGTSLMSAVLGAHPQIISFNYESYFFSREALFKSSFINRVWRLCKFYPRLIKQGVPAGKRFWCEKTPRNVLNLERLFIEFGKNIKVILMIRNGYDVLTSRHPNSEGYYISVDRWHEDTLATIKFQNHPQVLIVPYEGLINEFDYTVKRICDFLEINLSDEMRNFHMNTSVKAHEAFHGGNIEAIYKTSLSRWKLPEHKARTDEVEEIPELQSLFKVIENMSIEFLHPVRKS